MRPTSLLFGIALIATGQEQAVFDSSGRLASLVYGGDEVGVRAGLAVRGSSPPAPVLRGEDGTTWSGALEVAPGKRARFRQRVTEQAGRIGMAVEVTAEAELEADAVYFRIDLPRAEFVGGRAELGDQAGSVLPLSRPEGREFFRGNAAALRFRDAAGKLEVAVALDRARPVFLEDRWERSGRWYTAWIELHPGRLAPGGVTSLDATLSVAGTPDTSPARLTLDAGRRRYRFQGFGGNYCFNIESPVTQYTLRNLRVRWARTEMSASLWEPENDNDSPADTNWAVLESRDQPNSRLRREFLLAKQIQDLGIPYPISIWKLPEWLYEDPGKGPQASRRRVAADKWEELLETIGSYLVYAKRRYGVEPDLFSFNEANIGINVLLTPEEHREALKTIGAHFRKLGLKTKMLLADATGPRGTHEYALAAANDPEALQYVGALAFHSWGGATPEQYRAWGDLAEWLRLPLLVAELGVDAAAWRGRAYDSFHYGIREVGMYQELLLHARPQGTMQWEFTADYGLARARGEEVVPTPRFWFVKHFTDLTPPNSEALETGSDHPKVLFTAFSGNGSYALHVANLGAGRQVTIRGLPEGVRRWQAWRTSQSEAYQELAAVEAKAGAVTLSLPARCLLTLTGTP